MGRYKYYRLSNGFDRWPYWSRKGWHKMPLNMRGGMNLMQHPRTGRWWSNSTGETVPGRVVADYIGRRHPRMLRHYQWKKRKELVKFYDRARQTSHALGNEDWLKELASYM